MRPVKEWEEKDLEALFHGQIMESLKCEARDNRRGSVLSQSVSREVMENNRMKETRIWWAAIFLVTAAIVALIAAHASHDMLGLSRSTIRVDALRGAAIAGGLMLIFAVSRKFGRR